MYKEVRVLFLTACLSSVWAHPLSMSTSDLLFNERSALLRVRIPGHEVVHLNNPARDIGRSFRLLNGEKVLEPRSTLCRRPQGDDLACDLLFELPDPTGPLGVRSTIADAIVANHVHVLQAERLNAIARAIFDERRTEWVLDFRPLTTRENAVAGAVRALASGFSWTWLVAAAALGLASYTWREALVLICVFALAFTAGVFLSAPNGILFARRFTEVAIMAGSAYLLIESTYKVKVAIMAIAAAVPGFLAGLMLSPALPGAPAAWTAVLAFSLGQGAGCFASFAIAAQVGAGNRVRIAAAGISFAVAMAMLL